MFSRDFVRHNQEEDKVRKAAAEHGGYCEAEIVMLWGLAADYERKGWATTVEVMEFVYNELTASRRSGTRNLGNLIVELWYILETKGNRMVGNTAEIPKKQSVGAITIWKREG